MFLLWRPRPTHGRRPTTGWHHKLPVATLMERYCLQLMNASDTWLTDGGLWNSDPIPDLWKVLVAKISSVESTCTEQLVSLHSWSSGVQQRKRFSGRLSDLLHRGNFSDIAGTCTALTIIGPSSSGIWPAALYLSGYTCFYSLKLPKSSLHRFSVFKWWTCGCKLDFFH